VSRTRHQWIIVLLAAWILVGCSDPTDQDPANEADIIVANVGERVITLGDVAERVRASEGALSPQEVLDRLIRRNALIESAKKQGLAESEDVIAAWENALIRELRRTELDPQLAAARPAERDLRTLYEREYRRFQQPERRRLAMVLLPDKEAAEAFLEEWKLKDNPAPEVGFGKRAFEQSTHQRSRYSGGDLGWLTASDRPPDVPEEVIQAGFSLQTPGETAPPVSTGQGWGVVLLLEIEPASMTGFEAARPTLENEAGRELRQTMENQFYRRMEQAAEVRRHNEEKLQLLQQDSLPPEFRN